MRLDPWPGLDPITAQLQVLQDTLGDNPLGEIEVVADKAAAIQSAIEE